MIKITILVVLICIFFIVINVFFDGSNNKKQILIAAEEDTSNALAIPSEKEKQNIGKKIDSTTKKAYVEQLLKIGFKKTTYDRYIATGLSIEEAKRAISFDSAIGREYEPGSLAEGEKRTVFKMPHLTAVFEYSTLFSNQPTQTFITIHDKVVDPKKKVDGLKLKKVPKLHRKKN